MITNKNQVEPQLLGEAAELQKLRRIELFSRCLVAKSQHFYPRPSEASDVECNSGGGLAGA